ncbi:MAG: hypothetical protein J4F98_07295 [Acidobacteria bacterium]|nr:hypothetical protein [Acidobacteriota bacterium]
MAALGQEEVRPYFLSYEITQLRNFSASASFGALRSSNETTQRTLDIDLRVGDHELDNTRRAGDSGRSPFRNFRRLQIPVEDDPDSIRSILWVETDRHYRRAVQQLTQVRMDVQVKVQAEDPSPDFSREPASSVVEDEEPISVDPGEWELKVRRYSAPFAEHGDIYHGSASLNAETETRWFANSEGSRIRTSATTYRLVVSANTKADDGMELPLHKTYLSFTPEGVPDDDIVDRDVRRMIEILLALRDAPLVDPYTGPAILSGQASGVFFHEILGHRLEGHRLKDADDSHTFREQLNQKVLPESFSVHFDPTRRPLKPTTSRGQLPLPQSGIAVHRVTVIDEGIPRNFLMSRSSLAGFPNSNGHRRKQPGMRPVARHSYLIVEVADPLASDELKARFPAAIKAEDKPFGLRFDAFEGGLTFTGRFLPNVFNVTPLLVYRIYPDGRQELVRGVDLIGTPLTTLSRIVAADNQIDVFNGHCSAESGSVPVADFWS